MILLQQQTETLETMAVTLIHFNQFATKFMDWSNANGFDYDYDSISSEITLYSPGYLAITWNEDEEAVFVYEESYSGDKIFRDPDTLLQDVVTLMYKYGWIDSDSLEIQ